MKKALITGITGQDGSYLAELLLEKKYKVYGLIRRTSAQNLWRIEGILEKINIVYGDITDISSIIRAIEKAEPDEVYNLAAQSFVQVSWQEPLHTIITTGLGAVNVFEAVRLTNPRIKVYQASSSEMFGKVEKSPQNEETPFHPRSPYGVAKVMAHHAAVNYRESYGMFICSGILFNHESPRRGLEFVTRKITWNVARIKKRLQKELTLGNLKAQRDWGYAPEYVDAMWRMLQLNEPEDFVIGTGEMHSVEDFVKNAFEVVELNWEEYVKTDNSLLRPAEVEKLCADASKAKEKLGWTPRTSFKILVKIMVEEDLKRLEMK